MAYPLKKRKLPLPPAQGMGNGMAPAPVMKSAATLIRRTR